MHIEVRGQLCELVLSFYLYRDQTQVVRFVQQSSLPTEPSCRPNQSLGFEPRARLAPNPAHQTATTAKTLPNESHERDGKKCKGRSELLPTELGVLEHPVAKKTADDSSHCCSLVITICK